MTVAPQSPYCAVCQASLPLTCASPSAPTSTRSLPALPPALPPNIRLSLVLPGALEAEAGWCQEGDLRSVTAEALWMGRGRQPAGSDCDPGGAGHLREVPGSEAGVSGDPEWPCS